MTLRVTNTLHRTALILKLSSIIVEVVFYCVVVIFLLRFFIIYLDNCSHNFSLPLNTMSIIGRSLGVTWNASKLTYYTYILLLLFSKSALAPGRFDYHSYPLLFGWLSYLWLYIMTSTLAAYLLLAHFLSYRMLIFHLSLAHIWPENISWFQFNVVQALCTLKTPRAPRRPAWAHFALAFVTWW